MEGGKVCLWLVLETQLLRLAETEQDKVFMTKKKSISEFLFQTLNSGDRQ